MRNLKPFSLFVFFFTLACERIFIKAHSIESRMMYCRTRKYAACSTSVHLSAQNCYRLEGVNVVTILIVLMMLYVSLWMLYHLPLFCCPYVRILIRYDSALKWQVPVGVTLCFWNNAASYLLGILFLSLSSVAWRRLDGHSQKNVN